MHARYYVELTTGDDGRLYLHSAVLGDIPIPDDQQDKVRHEATMLKDLYDRAHTALGTGEIDECIRLTGEMITRWGGDMVEIRALQWELMQPCEE